MALNEKGIKVIRKVGTSKAGNPYTLYSLMYSLKVGEEWKNGFLDAQFPKETNLANKCKIKINIIPQGRRGRQVRADAEKPGPLLPLQPGPLISTLTIYKWSF